MNSATTGGSHRPEVPARTPPAGLSSLMLVMPLFFLSGATALTLENLWTRSLTHVFGSSSFAISTVLATFMGGLALGSVIAGRFVDRARRPGQLLAAYGVLEGVVGFYALALPWIITLVEQFNVFVWRSWQPSFYTFTLLRFAVTAALLIVPTTCMGATLPVLSRFVCHVRSELGKQAGTLYAVNTFGAMVGAFAAGFLLMPGLGMFRTNLVACATAILICAAAIFLARFLGTRPLVDDEPDAEAEPSVRPTPLRLLQARAAFWGIGLSGTVAMVYQVAWTRTLSLILGSSVYAFTLILICFLFGLAAGGAVYARRTAAQPGQAANLSVVHICIGFCALLGLLLTDRLPPAFLVLVKLLKLSPTSAFVSKFVLSAVLMGLPTFFMGMIFPATIRLAADTGKALGWTVGSVYSINTVGAIVGSFAGGFILIPYAGLQYTQAAMILCNVALAVVFASVASARKGEGIAARISASLRSAFGWLGPAGPARAGRLAAAAIVLFVLLAFYRPWNLQVMTSGVFRISAYELASRKLKRRKRGRARFRSRPAWKRWDALARSHSTDLKGTATNTERLVDSRIVFYREGIVTTVSVVRSVYEGIAGQHCWEGVSLMINGKADASVTGRFKLPRGRKCDELVHRPGAFGPPTAISRFGDTETQVMSGLIGVLLTDPEFDPQNALVVGWGSGITVGSLISTPVKRIVAIELEREVMRGARWFERYNHGAASHPKVRLLEGDGRTYVAAATERFDIIVSEPSNPWITGCSNLFTLDYFKLVRKRLAPGGKFVQWLQVYEISPRNVKVILATLARAFPHVRVMRPGFSPADLLLIASDRPLKLNHSHMSMWLKHPEVGPEARRIGVHKVEDLLVRFLTDGPSIRRFTAGMPLNTDDNALVEFSAPKDLINYYKYSPARISAALERTSPPLTKQVTDHPPELKANLAWAWLRAGHPDKARRLAGRRSCAAFEAIDKVAAILLREDEGRKALDRLPSMKEKKKKFSYLSSPSAFAAFAAALEDRTLPEDRPLGLAVLGCLLWELNLRTDALRFMWAAFRMTDGPERRAYSELAALFLHRLGLSARAVCLLAKTHREIRLKATTHACPRPGDGPPLN